MKKIKYYILLLLFAFSFTALNALSGNGGIDSYLRSKPKSNREGTTVVVVYSFAFNSNNNETVNIKMNYDEAKVKPVLITGVRGEPHAACKMVSAKDISCFNTEPKSEHNINVAFRLVKELKEDTIVKANISSPNKNVKFEKGVTETNIPLVADPGKSFNLISEALNIAAGEKMPINIELKDNVKMSDLKFTSLNPAIANVLPDGTVQALSEGSTTINIEYNGAVKKLAVVVGKQTDKCTLNSVKLANDFQISPGEVKSLDLELSDSCVKVKDLEYKSSNTDNLWVDANGYIIGLKSGQETVVISYNGKEMAKTNVTIGVPAKKNKGYGKAVITIVFLLIILGVVIYFLLIKPKKQGKLSRKEEDNDDVVAYEEKSLDELNNVGDAKAAPKDESDDESYFDGIDLDV